MEVDNSNLPVLLDSGDLRLLVTFSNQSLTWLGCSSSLSLGSPVWNKFLNPPFPKLVTKEGVMMIRNTNRLTSVKTVGKHF